LSVVSNALRSFNDARGAEAAASMAYYTFFSLFPLLLVFVFVASLFLGGEQAYRETVDFVTQAIPISRRLIEQNIGQVVDLRRTVGLVGLIGLLWSATGAFTVLARNVNRAWSEAESRNLLESRLIALAMVGTMIALMVLSLFSTAALSILPHLRAPLWGEVSLYETTLWVVLSNLIPWLFTFLMFLALYLWAPSVEVEWKAAFWGALVAGLAWEIAKRAFTRYVSSGLVRYELIYGSLGTVVALLFWIYLSSWITLFGSHLSAAIARRSD
jgi:membrane protein